MSVLIRSRSGVLPKFWNKEIITYFFTKKYKSLFFITRKDRNRCGERERERVRERERESERERERGRDKGPGHLTAIFNTMSSNPFFNARPLVPSRAVPNAVSALIDRLSCGVKDVNLYNIHNAHAFSFRFLDSFPMFPLFTQVHILLTKSLTDGSISG